MAEKTTNEKDVDIASEAFKAAKKLLFSCTFALFLFLPPSVHAATYDISGHWGLSTIEEIEYKHGNLVDLDQVIFTLMLATARGDVTIFEQNGNNFSNNAGDRGYISGATYYYSASDSEDITFFGLDITLLQSASRVVLTNANEGFYDFDIRISFIDSHGTSYNGTFYCKHRAERFYTPTEYEAAKQAAQGSEPKVVVIPLF